MVRRRNPGLDDVYIIRMIIRRLIPMAKKARPQVTFNRKELLRRLNGSKVLVAAAKGRPPVGFISFREISGIVHIDMLAVSKNAEGKGVGSALIKAAEGYGKRKGSQRCQLYVDEPNVHAQEFYERKGYGVWQYLPQHKMFLLGKVL